MSDEFYIPSPASMTVDHERKPVLYLPDGRVLVRQAGFRAPPKEQNMKTGPGRCTETKRYPKGGNKGK